MRSRNVNNRPIFPFDSKRLRHVASLRQLRIDSRNEVRPYVGLEDI